MKTLFGNCNIDLKSLSLNSGSYDYRIVRNFSLSNAIVANSNYLPSHYHFESLKISIQMLTSIFQPRHLKYSLRNSKKVESCQSLKSKTDYDERVRSICLNVLDLTNREIDCYLLLTEGCRSKEIGRKLGISYRTVEKHIENIKVKLNCKTLAGMMSVISRCLYNEFS